MKLSELKDRRRWSMGAKMLAFGAVAASLTLVALLLGTILSSWGPRMADGGSFAAAIGATTALALGSYAIYLEAARADRRDEEVGQAWTAWVRLRSAISSLNWTLIDGRELWRGQQRTGSGAASPPTTTPAVGGEGDCYLLALKELQAALGVSIELGLSRVLGVVWPGTPARPPTHGIEPFFVWMLRLKADIDLVVAARTRRSSCGIPETRTLATLIALHDALGACRTYVDFRDLWENDEGRYSDSTSDPDGDGDGDDSPDRIQSREPISQDTAPKSETSLFQLSAQMWALALQTSREAGLPVEQVVPLVEIHDCVYKATRCGSSPGQLPANWSSPYGPEHRFPTRSEAARDVEQTWGRI